MLEINGVSKVYSNGVHALNNINLSIGNGMFGLLGPNGAGKSSLMRTIATLQTPDTGKVLFNELDVLKQPNELRKELGYLPQEFGVYPRVSAYKLLDYLAVMKGITDKKVRYQKVNQLLEQTNLLEHKNKAVATFSGGMIRRFGIAQALIASPKLIIVDEPTAGLDPAERNRFYSLLSEVGEQATLILSTHIIEDIEGLCSEMAIINKGQLVSQGSVNSLSSSLNGKIWQANASEIELNQWHKSLCILSVKSIGSERVIRVFSEQAPRTEFIQVRPNLEDVYFNALNNNTSSQQVVV